MTENIEKHSPLPWRVAFKDCVTNSPIGFLDGTKVIAECGETLRTSEESQANAAFIALAANSFYSNQAALQSAKGFIIMGQNNAALEVINEALQQSTPKDSQ